MMQYFQQSFIDEEAPEGTPPEWDSPRKNLFVSPSKPSRKRSANSQSPSSSPAKAKAGEGAHFTKAFRRKNSS
jgi:hypothetical protein